jgi:hypothetical protein
MQLRADFVHNFPRPMHVRIGTSLPLIKQLKHLFRRIKMSGAYLQFSLPLDVLVLNYIDDNFARL